MKGRQTAFFALIVIVLLGLPILWVARGDNERARQIARLEMALKAEREQCRQVAQRLRLAGPLKPEWDLNPLTGSGSTFWCVGFDASRHHACPPVCNRYRLERCQ